MKHLKPHETEMLAADVVAGRLEQYDIQFVEIHPGVFDIYGPKVQSIVYRYYVEQGILAGPSGKQIKGWNEIWKHLEATRDM